MTSKGLVSLVGAGPGDRELISLKGWRCLQEADIVFYDYLVNERLLNACQESTPCVYVGKSAREHTLTQQNINCLLVQKAREGKRVVRLKGGDPFVFGRGGEEIIELKKTSIPFEIVPGITAAVAAPAYAGVPITHRNLSLSCTFITGHESDQRDSTTDWANLAGNTQTLMFYMGMKNLPEITTNLIAHGRKPQTPAIIIQHGTWGHQRHVSGTLETIQKEAQKAKITAPAIILIGSVVSLRQSLKWSEERPLFGKRLGFIGASGSKISELDECERQGALVWELPLIDSSGKEIEEPRFRATSLIARGEIDFLIFENLKSFESFEKNLPDCAKSQWLKQFVLGSLDQDLSLFLKEKFSLSCKHIKEPLTNFLSSKKQQAKLST